MTAQASFGSTADLIDKICRATVESTGSSFARQQVLDYLNMRYLMILSGKNWRFLREELYFDIREPYEVGTAVATQGSTLVTGTGTTWDSTMNGQKFQFPGDETVYEVDTVSSTTTLNLKSAYTDETKVDPTGYKIIFDTYVRIDEDIDAIHGAYLGGISGSQPNLRLVGLEHFRGKQKGTANITGQPYLITGYVQVENGEPDWVFELFPAPEKKNTVLIEYDKSVTQLQDKSSNYSLIPNKYQFVLFWAVVADMLADQKESNASASATRKFQAAYTKMCADYEMTDSRARFRNERPYFERARARSRYRRGKSYRERVDLT